MVDVSVVMSVKDKDDFKKSMDSISGQTLNDIELVCIDKDSILTDEDVNVVDELNPNDLNGKYTYFLYSGDVMGNDAFQKCFDLCEEKSLDFVQFDPEGESDEEVYNFNEFKARTFKLDMKRNTRFIRTSFIKALKEINEIDYLFFWDCIFNARKFSLIDIDFTPKEMPIDYISQIDDSNKVFTKFEEYGRMGKNKYILFDWRIGLLYDTYLQVSDDLKESCYEAYKKDFTQMIYHWRFTDFSVFCEPISKLFFNDIVYSNDFEEFKKLMVQYEIELDTLEVEKQQEIIKKNIKILENENKLILNSTSWKLTEPLRKLR